MAKKASTSSLAAAVDDLEARSRIVEADLAVAGAMLRRALLDGSSTAPVRKIILGVSAEAERIAEEILARAAAVEAAQMAEAKAIGDALFEESLRNLGDRIDQVMSSPLPLKCR